MLPSSSSQSSIPLLGSAGTQTTGTVTGTQTSTSSSAPTATAPAFICPDDNNTVVSQMIGSSRYDYLVLCDIILNDSNFYGGGLTYSTFGECVAACSVADTQFNAPVCQGASYFSTGQFSSGNCALKSSSNYTFSETGADSALLQSIQVGITPNSTGGTTTESAPFSDMPMTQSPDQLSSSMSSVLSNSSNSMPIVTPPYIPQSGMLVQAPITAYSTFVSAGSTYSHGTQYSFSTHFSNGSWYETYYTSYTEAWASATTVYGASSTGYAAQNSTNSNSQQVGGPNGEYSKITETNTTSYYPEGYNVTQVMSNQTYDSNGTEIFSTATTGYYSYQTASSANGSGGAQGSNAGGPASGGAGPVTSTSFFTTQTDIVSSGGTGSAGSGYGSGYGSGAGGAVPSTAASTIVNSYGTAYSSGYVISEGTTGTGGASSNVASGGAESTQIGTPSVIINSYGTGGSSGFAASGGPTGTGGASGGAASGGPSSTPSGPISVGINTYGTAGSSGFAASGGPTGSPTSHFSDTGLPRSPYPGDSSSLPGTAPLGTGSPSTSPTIPVFTGNTGGYAGFPPGTAPISSTDTFENSGLPRSPYPESSSVPQGTVPPSNGPSPYQVYNGTGYPTGTAPPGYPSPSGTSPNTFGNSGLPRSPYPGESNTPPGTAPGTVPAGYPGPSGTSPRTAPSGNTTSPSTFTDTGLPRSPYPPGSGTPTGTGSMILSTGPTTCANMTMVRTLTVTTTESVLDCQLCAPAGGGGYGGSQTFGPPIWANPTVSA